MTAPPSPSAAPVIGFMADSHGRPETIAAALARFHGLGCREIYHLGDICDSARPERAAECVDLLVKARVTAVRGNNDHALVAGLRDDGPCRVPDSVRRFLTDLPLRRMIPGAVLAHGLPFDREMGLSCMMASMDEAALARVTEAFPGRILFRGHSHAPEAAGWQGGRYVRRPLAAGGTIDLKRHGVAALTCGALTRGLCMIWAPDEGRAACLSIFES